MWPARAIVHLGDRQHVTGDQQLDRLQNPIRYLRQIRGFVELSNAFRNRASSEGLTAVTSRTPNGVLRNPTASSTIVSVEKKRIRC